VRVLFWGDLPVSSGFGRISSEIAKRFVARGHQVTGCSMMWGGGPIDLPYYTYSAAPPKDLWQTTVDVVNQVKPEVIISAQDFPYHHTLYWGCRIDFSTIAWVVITPIDGTPIAPDWLSLVDIPDGFMVISKFGVEAMRQAGKHVGLCHPGVDRLEFHPCMPDERAALRKQVGIPADAFVVGMMAVNQGRKCIPHTVEGFKEFSLDKPNAYLYLDMEKESGAGWHLPHLVNQVGLDPKKVIYRADVAGKLPMLGDRYRICDVMSVLSFREGFGLPLLEAQACGVVAVAQDWCSGTELVGGGKGILVPVAKYANGKPIFMHGTWGGAMDALPDMDVWVSEMNRLYNEPIYRASIALAGQKWAWECTWDKAADAVEETMIAAVRKKKMLPQPPAPPKPLDLMPIQKDDKGPGGQG
jgi:glycosyltransferase involved in cell wall biosynthesis